MVNVASIQNAYNKMYADLQNYIWGFEVVTALAELEDAAYTRCPDMFRLRKSYDKFYALVKDVAKDDEALKEHMDAFKAVIDSDDTPYAKLNKVNEVIVTDEDSEED